MLLAGDEVCCADEVPRADPDVPDQPRGVRSPGHRDGQQGLQGPPDLLALERNFADPKFLSAIFNSYLTFFGLLSFLLILPPYLMCLFVL